MKKSIFFAALAATAMLTTGCSNDETMEVAQPKAIGFSNVFVNNGTRSAVDPSYTKDNLTEFAVYGFTQNGQIFDGEKVTKGEGSWTYSPVKYWVEDNQYVFAGVAPANVAVTGEKRSDDGSKVEMTISNFTNDGKNDLIIAQPAAIDADATFMGSIQPVHMQFSHMLSKVKFSFVNSVGEGHSIKVKNIKITDAKESGTLNVAATNTWSDVTGSTELDFGNAVTEGAGRDEASAIANGAEGESYNEMLMIPYDNSGIYTVTFTVELYSGDVLLGTYNHTTQIQNVALQLGYCYDFKATLTAENITEPDDPQLQPIEFTVDGVDSWNEGGEQEVDVPTMTPGQD